MLRKPDITPLIPFRTIAEPVAFAIDFDAELGGVTIEIQNIGAKGGLPAKVAAIENVWPDLSPKQNFREAHLLAQTSGSRDGSSRMIQGPIHHASRGPPSPMGKDFSAPCF